MDDNDKILAKDLISINRVSLLLTGNEFTLRWDRGFGKYKASVDRLLFEVQDWIDSDKNNDDLTVTRITAYPNISKEFAGVKIFQNDILLNPEYEYIASVPFGTSQVEVIGYKLHKSDNKDIWYVKLKVGQVVVLYSEKDVKAFIRKELIK